MVRDKAKGTHWSRWLKGGMTKSEYDALKCSILGDDAFPDAAKSWNGLLRVPRGSVVGRKMETLRKKAQAFIDALDPAVYYCSVVDVKRATVRGWMILLWG
jgi:hypothetical protein